MERAHAIPLPKQAIRHGATDAAGGTQYEGKGFLKRRSGHGVFL